MLEYKLTPHHAGIALWGDGAALDRLHEFVHHVVAKLTIDASYENLHFFLLIKT